MKTRRFGLEVVLSVTTHRLLTERRGPRDNGIGDLYDILNWMTNDDLMTHQLPRAGDECKPWLLRWFPELGKAEEELGHQPGGLDHCLKSSETLELAVEQWLTRVEADCGLKPFYDVPRIPADDHDRIDPYDELVQMRGTDENIEIVWASSED